LYGFSYAQPNMMMPYQQPDMMTGIGMMSYPQSASGGNNIVNNFFIAPNIGTFNNNTGMTPCQQSGINPYQQPGMMPATQNPNQTGNMQNGMFAQNLMQMLISMLMLMMMFKMLSNLFNKNSTTESPVSSTPLAPASVNPSSTNTTPAPTSTTPPPASTTPPTASTTPPPASTTPPPASTTPPPKAKETDNNFPVDHLEIQPIRDYPSESSSTKADIEDQSLSSMLSIEKQFIEA